MLTDESRKSEKVECCLFFLLFSFLFFSFSFLFFSSLFNKLCFRSFFCWKESLSLRKYAPFCSADFFAFAGWTSPIAPVFLFDLNHSNGGNRRC